MVVTADLERPEKGAYCLGTPVDQPGDVPGIAWALGVGPGSLAGPVDHPSHHGQPDPGSRLLRCPFDRFQHPGLAVPVSDACCGVDQGTSLGRGEFSDPVSQDGQRAVIGRDEPPPFSPTVVTGCLRLPAAGPIRALHNASLIST